MIKYLALMATLTASMCQAEGSPPSRPAPELRQVSVEKPAPSQSVTPRQLSAQERAELRRQLSQYSRPAGKGS